MPSWGNLRNWIDGSIRDRELSETRSAWTETERLWRASPLAQSPTSDHALAIVCDTMRTASRGPSIPILVSLCETTEALLSLEDIGPLEPDWLVIERNAEIAVRVRQMLVRRQRFASDFDRTMTILAHQIIPTFRALFDALPDACFGDHTKGETFEVPLLSIVENPISLIQGFTLFPYDDAAMERGLFLRLREQLVTNMLVASGFPPETNPHEVMHRLKAPSTHGSKDPEELADLYLRHTPLRAIFALPVPFQIPDESRYEHTHILGGTGHGKTQLMQRMIYADILKAKDERRSVVVIDSQGDLIGKLMRQRLFDPDEPDNLADKLVIIDPADVEHPAALNLFDAHLDRVRSYSPVDRERVLNGVIELYELFFSSMLGAELTQKQGVIFRYLARLMLTIPEATIHTLMQLMEDGKRFKPYMEKLDGSARYFFETEFPHPSFSATKKQILKRLWGVLSTPAFERMFAQPTNKLDLFEALQDGRIILISTAKDLLKSEGSALFGRFFIAMIAQTALERSTLPASERTPTFVYVDEAQEYFDDSIETILNQARKYRVSLTLAHQTLDQLSPRLRSAILANTSMKCVGGVSAKDARTLADELRTDTDFLEGMRRRGDRSEFAVWVKHLTPHAIKLNVPLGYLERQPILSEEAFAEVLSRNRARYCGRLADVRGFDFANAEPVAANPVPEPAREQVPAPPVSTPIERVTPPPPRELGKGGPQHRYVQHLIKGLAEERGYRAVIEEPTERGQIDVALHRNEIRIACEISVTSTPSYEAKNLAKCLRAGFTRVFAVAIDRKQLRLVENKAREQLSDDELACVSFLTPEEVADALDALSAPLLPEDTIVRGYRVKVKRSEIGAADAKDRRATVARVIAQSMRNLPKKS